MVVYYKFMFMLVGTKVGQFLSMKEISLVLVTTI